MDYTKTYHIPSTPPVSPENIALFPSQSPFPLSLSPSTEIIDRLKENIDQDFPVHTSPVKVEPTSLARKKIRLFLIDDNPINTRLLAAICKKIGLENITQYNTFTEARTAIETEQFDVIISDQQIPAPPLQGHNLAHIRRCREVKQGLRPIPFLILTSTLKEIPDNLPEGLITKACEKPAEKKMIDTFLTEWFGPKV